MTRRNLLKLSALAGVGALLPSLPVAADAGKVPQKAAAFRFCLNTSTISGQNPGLLKYIDIAAKAGYSGVELWVRDVKQYLDAGNKASDLKKYIEGKGLTVENAIGFAPWLTPEGMQQMKQEMEMMGSIGCKRMAAPIMLKPGEDLDMFEAGKKYRALIELGKQTGLKPLLEFWGASKALYHIGQAMMIAAIANHPDVCILADVYHMFRGGSGYDTLKMLKGNTIEVFHMNDFVSTIPREEQKDSDRVYPGDGAAPMKQILTDLKNMGGTKILSLELFNKEYWAKPAEEVAKTGIEKMKALVAQIA